MAAEETITRCLVLDQTLGVFVDPVVEWLAWAQRLAVGNAKCPELAGRAFDTHGDVAQVHRLAGLDADDQLRGWSLSLGGLTSVSICAW